MSWEISWADMCRACMESDSDLISLYDDDDDETIENDLPKKLAELTSVEIKKGDGLPNKICEKCVDKTNILFEFKCKVQDSNKKLKDIFEEQMVCFVKMEQIDNDECTVTESENCNVDENGKAMSCQNVNENSFTEEMGPIEETVENTVTTEELEKACKTVVLSIENNFSDIPAQITNEVQNVHIIINADDLNSIDKISQSQFIKNLSNNEIQNVGTLSSTIGEVVPETEVAYSIQISSDTIKTKSNEIALINCTSNSEKVIQDSDSDNPLELEQNIVGSLNDTITKVKEIREAGKTVYYQCTLCLRNYPELSKALIHLVKLHVPSSGPFYCVVCEMDCDSIKHLKDHVKTHTGPTPYTCFLCNKSYVMKRYLKRHMACHTDFPRHRCAKCGERFKIKSELDTHISSHSQQAAFKCSQCPRIFNHKGNYKRHLISHLDPQGLHLPKYPCNICNRRFLNNRTLVTHMRVHTGEKPYKCEICSREFSQQGNLFNHQKIHTNPRSFTCEVCGKSFNQKATLRDHSLLHSGEKPYVCSVCGMAFTFSAALRRHSWNHTDGKPFECDICNAKFVGRYDLRRHMNIHSKRSKPTRNRTSIKNKKEEDPIAVPEVIHTVHESTSTDTIFVEQIFVCDGDNSIQIIAQEDSEKENVNSLLGLIQYQ